MQNNFCFSVKEKTLFPFLYCFSTVIFRLDGKICIVKNEKSIVIPESRYVNSNPDINSI